MARHPSQTELGRRASTIRKERGLSQMALAELVNLHFTFVSQVERGQRNLSLASLLRLAEGLDVNPAVLVDGLRWTIEPDEEEGG
jgi:transcriptional regulator with XRE-family HTH domain